MLLVFKHDFNQAISVSSINVTMNQRRFPVSSPIQVVPPVADGCSVSIGKACSGKGRRRLTMSASAYHVRPRPRVQPVIESEVSKCVKVAVDGLCLSWLAIVSIEERKQRRMTLFLSFSFTDPVATITSTSIDSNVDEFINLLTSSKELFSFTRSQRYFSLMLTSNKAFTFSED